MNDCEIVELKKEVVSVTLFEAVARKVAFF